jgi:hypothetical protein
MEAASGTKEMKVQKVPKAQEKDTEKVKLSEATPDLGNPKPQNTQET